VKERRHGTARPIEKVEKEKTAEIGDLPPTTAGGEEPRLLNALRRGGGRRKAFQKGCAVNP